MKKLVIGIALISSLVTVNGQCADWKDNWTINGVKIDDALTVKGVTTIAGAMITTSLVHWSGHYLMSRAVGIDFEQHGFIEKFTDDISSDKRKLFDLSGFITQLGIGTALKHSRYADDLFERSYNAWTFAGIVTYPAFMGDLGNGSLGDFSTDIGDTSFSVFVGWSVLNLK